MVSTLPAGVAGESIFLYEVKLVDEFIERFNDDPGCYLREQCRIMFGTDTIITRPRLLRSLFNQKQQWDANVSSFINQVIGQKQTLSFTADDWYAEASCVMVYKGKEVTVPVFLDIRPANDAAEWKIAGIGAAAMFTDKPALPAAAPPGQGAGQFLPTSSHGTDFAVFYDALSAAGVSESYFEPAALRGRGQTLISLLRQKRVTFKYVKELKFHFFGIPGWYFTVNRFKRKETNSGWLISTLKPLSDKEKTEYLAKLLGSNG
jgi:hypothetical protein